MILKYQLGGAAIPPLVNYDPVMIQPAQEASTVAETKKEEKGLADKDILGLLKDLDGLPNDVLIATLLLLNFFIDRLYTPKEFAPSIASQYIQIVNLINRIKFDRAAYNDAYKAADKKGSLNEYAINERGYILCLNGEDFQFLKPELIEDSGYMPLTNSEVLRLRAYSPLLAYNNNLLDIVKGSTSMEVINKQIKDIISNLGSTTQSSEGYARSALLISGMNLYLAAILQVGESATPELLYKNKVLTKDLAQLANAALSYVYSSLPENARTLIKTRTLNKTLNEALALVALLIGMSTSSISEFLIDWQKDKSRDNEENGVKADLVTLILAGHGGHDTIYELNNKSGISMTVNGHAYEQIKDISGNHIGRTSVENLLNQSGLRSIINADNGIYFGNLKVDLDSLLNIAYDGKGLLRTNLPIRTDGSPNFSILEEYSKALSEFLLSNQTNEDRLRIFGDSDKYPNLNALITPTGELNKSMFAPFIVVSGITTNGLINIEDNNKYITEVKSTPELIGLIKTSLATGSGKNTIYPNIDEYDWSEWLLPEFINSYDHIFKGNIYIPLNMNKLSAALGDNLSLKLTTGQSLEEEYLKRDINITKLDPSILNN